jgi:AcrR family transcriptional regulator
VSARTPSDAVAAEVLAAARRLLERDGEEALTVRGIAREAGVAPMSLYNHFHAKDGVVDELVVRGFERLRQEIDGAAGDPDPTAALIDAGRRYRQLALEAPATYRMMHLRADEARHGDAARVLEAGADAFSALVRLVARVQFTAGIDEPPEVGAQAVWAMVHGWVSLELAGKVFTDDPEASFERLLSAGVAAASASGPPEGANMKR